MLPSHEGSLFDPRQEHDACGVGFVASTNGPSHEVLEHGLVALGRLAHRGAADADGKTGDGAGILVQVPQELVVREYARLGGRRQRARSLGVGVFFLPRGAAAWAARTAVEHALAAEGLGDAVWRTVPTMDGALGPRALATRPSIMQLLVPRPVRLGAEPFERRLYRARRRAERAFGLLGAAARDCHVVSFSARTMVYKGLMLAAQLAAFYPDLADPGFVTAGVIYHQRYSTNTTPSWRRAQPFRRLAHNGEINTLQGNVNWMRARQADLRSSRWAGLGEALWPVVDPETSDSGMLDNVVEFLHLSGRDLRQIMMMLVPEAWEGIPDLPAARREFYHFQACLVEPWDGPAALVFGDGRLFGAVLDRNGLRPMRYAITADGWVAAGSEAGAVALDPARVTRYGKLGPGEILCVDLGTGRVLQNEDVKDEVSARHPYGRWLGEHLVRIGQGSEASAAEASPEPELPDRVRLQQLQRAFAYTHEEIVHLIRPMVEHGKEAIGSMGDDTPHAVLSDKERSLFHYFKQRFAEVTNPPIDHLREDLVFSLRTRLGPRRNTLGESPGHAHLIELESPILLAEDLARMRDLAASDRTFRMASLDAVFARADGPAGLLLALGHLCREAADAVDRGAGLLVLSDRALDGEHVAIPSLLATGAVHHHLIRAGRRMRVGLIVESGEPREVHHLAALIGYGANAVHPYLVLQTVGALAAEGRLKRAVSAAEAQVLYRQAAEEGLKKVMSKMGISVVEGYAGAQIFEAIGVAADVVDLCFLGTPSRFGGSGFEDFGRLALLWHEAAFAAVPRPPELQGFFRFRQGGEIHEFSPEAVDAMHHAVRAGVVEPDGRSSAEIRELYRHYLEAVERPGPSQLRHLLALASDRGPIPLEAVEPVQAIVRRFSSGAMSLGSLSPEAHETLAIGMNRLGARSASGEGGEDAARFGTEKNSAIKQVASGRFGVTPAYLASAVELQIKMAQGSKPGEGGQIPGQKVTEYIARIRHTTPGVALISPPPHHDIYSIEDLAQLIYDLKRFHPTAEVSVKLVAQSGVGVIAAGVAKGCADLILISGHAGGTGSSPLASIKNAGLPWELGLAETQQALVANGLRGRVGLRVDGGLKTGQDVVRAALLGADQYSFGTAAMIAEGCIMARICHTDNCPVGVTSQKEALRRKFPGQPQQVMNFFLLVAQEIREILASMGYRSLDEIIGRTDLLRQVRTGHPAVDRLDLGPLLAVPPGAEGQPRHRTEARNPLPAEEHLDERLLEAARQTLESGTPTRVQLPISNADRTIGARLGWEIARRHGDQGLPPGSIQATLTGVAGQSFGAFLPQGVRLELVGLGNDYVGKALAGGELVVRGAPALRGPSAGHVLLGNAVLYGATAGRLLAAGCAGERFAVRNSGASAVIEGVGNHGCEYMTGGTVVVLGSTGQNFAAGMTGGEAFVLDLDRQRLNGQLVDVTSLLPADLDRLWGLVAAHAEQTGSARSRELLGAWASTAGRISRVAPRGEVRKISSEEEGAMSAD